MKIDLSSVDFEKLRKVQEIRAAKTYEYLETHPDMVIPYPIDVSGLVSLIPPKGNRDPQGGLWATTKQSERPYLKIVASVQIETDEEFWYHVSLSREDRLPCYHDVQYVKQIFMGDRLAIQLFVPKAEHININPNVLHLWSCLSKPPALPDFSAGTGSI